MHDVVATAGIRRSGTVPIQRQPFSRVRVGGVRKPSSRPNRGANPIRSSEDDIVTTIAHLVGGSKILRRCVSQNALRPVAMQSSRGIPRHLPR